MQLFKNTNIDFLGIKKYCFILSGLLIFAGLISLAVHGGPRWGIDFTGGRVLELDFGKDVDISQVRDVLAKNGWQSVEVTSITEKPWFSFRVPMELDESFDDFSTKMLETMRLSFSDTDGYNVSVLSNEKVGPKVGQELRNKALWAVLLSLIAMLIYIWFRFQFRFGAAAVIALFHDALITIGIFSILNYEITLTFVAALLTLLGYSINDSIVVADRIRENMTKLRKLPFGELINKSINQTLSRTIITSLTTWVVVATLFVLGGSVIRDFAFALTFGIIIGTYSSIFIVAPIVAEWENWFPKKVGVKAPKTTISAK